MCADLLGAEQGLVVRHGLHPLLPQRLEGARVLPQIQLGADEDDGDIGGMMVDLGVPLCFAGVEYSISLCSASSCLAGPQSHRGTAHLSLDVVERGRADDGEADQEHVGLGVRERSQPVVVLLASRIP